MRNTQAVEKFVERWSGFGFSKYMLHDYKKICKNLLYEEEGLVRTVTSTLVSNIELWAVNKSKAYSNHQGIMEKGMLNNKSEWYVDEVKSESMQMATSGSTTGHSFHYLRWEPFLYFIEADNHYDLILDEFGVPENPNILNMFNSTLYNKSEYVTVRSDSKNFMDHHGTSRKANVHYVNFELMNGNPEIFFENIVNYLMGKKMDVIFAPGPAINSLRHYLEKRSKKIEVCGLLSNSNEPILSDDANLLLDGYVDGICDHMRCWDGGASFFTCKHGTYHLMDNLSWCEESEGRLISTDYFSLPSPFVRYWNGDYCRISEEYKRCECGRLYREFELLESRPFSLKGVSMRKIREKIDSMEISGIKQVRCSLESIDVVSSSPLTQEHRSLISSASDKFAFRFIVEGRNSTPDIVLPRLPSAPKGRKGNRF
jgi:hypothetical protein